MLSSGRKKSVKFRGRVLFVLSFFILFSVIIFLSRSATSGTTPIAVSSTGLDEVRQQTQEFVDQYTKQLLADFKHIKPSEDQSHAKSSVQDGITDPNKVSHKDSNPLLPSQEKIKTFTTFSDVMADIPTKSTSFSSTSTSTTTSSSSSITTSTDGAGKNIVIGMAQDTDSKNLVTFCASLRKHSQADVVLFMNLPISERNQEIVKKYNIQVIPFRLSDFDAEFQAYHPSTLRWIMMDNFFEADENINKYTHVWMIDVRDSMFQADPFAMISQEKSAFYAFKGVEDKTISQCGWNGGWIKDCFGQAKLNKVGNNNIICSGVSVGTIDVVQKYLKSMRKIVEGKTSDAKFPSCERNGVDQGIHNVLVHTKQIENLVIFNQASSPVLNLQARIANVDENNGIVKNKAGKLAAVVHQYDRFPALQKTLFQQYAYWIDFSDADFEWKADAQCQLFEYVKDVDLFKGICDYKKKGGMTGASSCCSVCTSLPECTSFTFFGGQCFLKKACTGKTKSMKSRLAGAVSAYYK